MRKMVFLPMFLALVVADFSAFGATNRRVVNTGENANTSSAPVARAATSRSAVRNAVSSTQPSSVTAVRSAQRQAITPTVQPTVANGARSAVARAGTTQKVINLGTKVQSATENTVVSQECQDAYYGCMDAFCMLDNTSGGRCQCSDRNKDLDLVLEEIMKLDEQSLAMATEGVERLQMGENADAIMARVKAATDKVTTPDQKSGYVTPGTTNGKTVRTLDLSAWRSGSLFDEDDGLFDTSAFESMESTLADKTGDALQSAAAKICVERIPTQCKASGSFLQLTYAQKIKSDCTAYENSLKQQRSQSAEKLQTAQKALRDAALEMYQNENKYDLGECVVRFKQCMQTTGECGEDYSGCVADTAILDSLYNRRSGNIATTTIKTGATSVKISSATYDILNTKKIMCESVTKQCVNANKKDAVWNQVIKDLAPVVYTAEYNAASNNRMNCINTVVKCVQTACGSKWDDNTDNFDACLSDPKSINNYCKLEFNRCGDTASQGNVENYVMAKLAAMKVDKCTTDVRECLLSEDRCGPDYSGCVGLDTDSIVDLCPEDKLLSCQDRSDGKDVRDYIAQIAQGIALNIDNKFAVACQNAVDAAYARECGAEMDDEESDSACPNLVLSNNNVKGSMKWEYCQESTNGKCYPDLSYFSDAEIESKTDMIIPKITGDMSELSEIKFQSDGSCDGQTDVYFCLKNGATPGDNLEKLLADINRDYSLIINRIASDRTVTNCREGRTLQGIGGTTRKNGGGTADDAKKLGRSEGRFENILSSAENNISAQILNAVLTDYYSEISALRDSGQADKMRSVITKRRQQIVADRLFRELLQGTKNVCSLNEEEFSSLMSNAELKRQLKQVQDEENQKNCASKDYNYQANFGTSGFFPSWFRSLFGGQDSKNKLVTTASSSQYLADTSECKITLTTYSCKQTRIINRNVCKKWDTENPTVSVKKLQMPEWNTPQRSVFCQNTTVANNSGGDSGIALDPSVKPTDLYPANHAAALSMYNNNQWNSQDWSAKIGDVTLTGIGRCGDKSGANYAIAESGWEPPVPRIGAGFGNGDHCWCKITSPVNQTRWVSSSKLSGIQASCSTFCGWFCADAMNVFEEFRKNMYTAAGILKK